MTPQNYIQQKLEHIKNDSAYTKNVSDLPLEQAIEKVLLSKKFRKYSASVELQEQIRNAIKENVANNKPINLTFLNGAYKLWRLEESPDVDWAELFTLMYFTNCVKPICEIYKPGVHFDFFMDDFIIQKLNNVSRSDIESYINSFNELLKFLARYQPDNLRMTLTTVGSQFESEQAFDELLESNLKKLTESTPGGLVEMTEEQGKMVELNAKPTEEQLKDPKWREKIWHLHMAYFPTKAATGYHKDRTDKILVFTQPLPSGTTISVGTTKTSVAKFWTGVGVLEKRGDGFIETILTPSQLEKTDYKWESIAMDGLEGKNFDKIRIIEPRQ